MGGTKSFGCLDEAFRRLLTHTDGVATRVDGIGRLDNLRHCLATRDTLVEDIFDAAVVVCVVGECT